MSIKDYSTTADENTQINGINIAENCPPSGINNAIRQLMADVAEDVTPVANPVGGLEENVFLGSTQPIENEPFKPAWKKLADLADGSSILFENGKFSSAIPGFGEGAEAGRVPATVAVEDEEGNTTITVNWETKAPRLATLEEIKEGKILPNSAREPYLGPVEHGIFHNYEYVFFTSNTTYTPTVNQRIVYAVVIGGGNSGGAVSAVYTYNGGAGGGGGKLCILQDGYFKKGVAYPMSIGGAGGGASILSYHTSIQNTNVSTLSTAQADVYPAASGGASAGGAGGSYGLTATGKAGTRISHALMRPFYSGTPGAGGGANASDYSSQGGGGGAGGVCLGPPFVATNPTGGSGGSDSRSTGTGYGGAGGTGFGAGGGGAGNHYKNNWAVGGGAGTQGVIALILENCPGGAL